MMSDRLVATLRAYGQLGPEQFRERPLLHLTWRHHAMARLMVLGSSDAALAALVPRDLQTERRDGKNRAAPPLPPLLPGEPFSVAEAGRLLGWRNGFSRDVAADPAFEAALAALGGRTMEHEEPTR